MNNAKSGRWRRLRHRAGLDRNPLRRHVDHVQTVAGWLLVAAFLVGSPIAATIVEPPETGAQIVAATLVAGMGVVIGTGAAGALGFLVLRFRLNRRRHQAWEGDWAAFDLRGKRPGSYS